MSKYTEDQLKSMAKETLEAKNEGNPLYSILLMKMMMLTGLTQDGVEYKIKELADTGKTL